MSQPYFKSIDRAIEGPVRKNMRVYLIWTAGRETKLVCTFRSTVFDSTATTFNSTLLVRILGMYYTIVSMSIYL